MSSLVLHAFQLHQKAANLFIPHCFYWDNGKRMWKYESETRKLLPYYLLNFGILGFIGLLCDLFLIVANIIDPTLFKMNQVIIYIFLLWGIPIILLEDLLMYFYGKELIAVMNWSINMESISKDKYKDVSLKEAITEELRKLKNGEFIDLYGICMNYIVASYIFFATAIPLLAVYEDWDPIYLVLLAFDSQKIIGGLRLASNPFYKAVRFLSISLLSQSAFMSTRAFTLVVISLAQTITNVLSSLLKMRVIHQQVRKYREFGLCFRLLDDLLRPFIGGYLCLIFFLHVLSFSITLLGWKFISFDFYTFLPPLSFTLACFTVFAFRVGSLILETSKSILSRWMYQTRTLISRSHMTRILNGLRPLHLPVGNVGKMDKEMRMEYFQSLLYYIMNFLIVFRDMVR